jgi:ABC-type sugar transport system substrate-binding protein
VLSVHGPDRLHGIIAANDDMAVGVAEALAMHGLAGRVQLVGGDGDAEVLDHIRSGLMAGTAFQDPAQLAVTALDHVLGVCAGTIAVADFPRSSIFHAPAGPAVAICDVPYTWIDRENLALLATYWAARTTTTPVAVANPA